MKKYFLLLCIPLLICCEPALPPSALQVASGTVIRHENFASKHIPARHVDVWLPANYSAKKKYNVLYMHDGQMLYDSTITWNKQEWGVDEVVGKLLDEGKINDCLVVGVWNGGDKRRTTEYYPQKAFYNMSQHHQDSILQVARGLGKFSTANGPESDLYLKFLVEELKPFIDAQYPTLPQKENTFIMGSSYGGLISMYAICQYPEVFGAAACLSTHWTGTYNADNNPIPASFLAYLDQNVPAGKGNRLYFDYGTATLDALYEPFQLQADSIMQAKGFNESNWVTRKFEGEDHSEKAWNKRLDIPLTFLLKKK